MYLFGSSSDFKTFYTEVGTGSRRVTMLENLVQGSTKQST